MLTLIMPGQIFKRILFLLFFASFCEVFVYGSGLSQRTTGNGCAICKLLKTLVNKQNEISQQQKEISQQNKNLEKKIDLLLGAKANCSEGGKVIF